MKKTAGILLFALAFLGIGSIAAASVMWTSTNVKPVITLMYKDSSNRNIRRTVTLSGYFEMDQDNNRNIYIRLLALNNDRSMVIAAQAIGMGIPQAGGGINAVLCREEQLDPPTLNLGTGLTMTVAEALLMGGTYRVDGSNKCSGNITLTAVGTLDAFGSSTPARMTAAFHLPVMPAQVALSNFSTITRDMVPPPASQTPPTAKDISASMAFGTTTSINLLKGAQSFQADGTLTAFTDSAPPNGHISSVTNGKVTYSSNAGFEGNDIFTYHVTDSNFLTSAVQQVSISVGGKPSATPLVLKVDKNSTGTASPTLIDFSSLNLGANVYVSNVTGNTNGTITQTGSKWYYTPNTGFTGFDTLTYTLATTANNTVFVTGEVDVEVCPIAVNYFQPLSGNSAQVNVLTNDIKLNASDTMSVTRLSTPLYGTVTQSGGVITYLNTISTTATEDTFTYTVTESGINQTSTGVVTILLH
jgi:hypothetical protein